MNLKTNHEIGNFLQLNLKKRLVSFNLNLNFERFQFNQKYWNFSKPCSYTKYRPQMFGKPKFVIHAKKKCK